MAAMASVDTYPPGMEDGPCLQQENSTLRKTITHLTEQLRVAEREKSDAVTLLRRQLHIVEEEKSAIAAQL